MKFFILLTLVISLITSANAQSIDTSKIESSNNGFTVNERADSSNHEFDDSSMEKDNGIYNLLTTKEFWLSVGILLLLLIILSIEAIIIRSAKFSEDATIKLLVMTIVILGVLFLFVSGYSDKQVAPAFGLFGTISGYIFGKSSNKNNNE